MFYALLDLSATFVFALSGGTAAVKRRLDLFGVMVVAFAAGNAGGITRDILIGAVPPAAIDDWRYPTVSTAAGLLAFFRNALLEHVRSPVQMFDAAGLALFAVSGASKALDFDLGPLGAIMLGVLTGIGGGMLRDILVGRVPHVLRADLYAVAALAGATVVVLGRGFGLPPTSVTIAGAALCFGLRYIAIRRGWQLPTPRG